jgi:hypothetical protein
VINNLPWTDTEQPEVDHKRMMLTHKLTFAMLPYYDSGFPESDNRVLQELYEKIRNREEITGDWLDNRRNGLGIYSIVRKTLGAIQRNHMSEIIATDVDNQRLNLRLRHNQIIERSADIVRQYFPIAPKV